MDVEPEEKDAGGLKLTKKQSMPKGSEGTSKLQKGSSLSEAAKNVSNPALRKKVCQKLAQYLEDYYELKKDIAREKTMVIECKIRISDPAMKEDYKNRSITIMGLIKAKQLVLEEVTDKDPVDWSFLSKNSI